MTGPNARRSLLSRSSRYSTATHRAYSVVAASNSGVARGARGSPPRPAGKATCRATTPRGTRLALSSSTPSRGRLSASMVSLIAAVISADSRVAYVSTSSVVRNQSRLQSAAVRVDALESRAGVASSASISQRVRSCATFPLARHPTALAWDEARRGLYVAPGTLTRSPSSIRESNPSHRRDRPRAVSLAEAGLAPTALALSPDRHALRRARRRERARGLRLPARQPTSRAHPDVVVSVERRRERRRKYIAVGSCSVPAPATGTSRAKCARYVFAARVVNVVPTPDGAELSVYHGGGENDRLILASAGPPPAIAASLPRAVPERPGDSSLDHHVVFIVQARTAPTTRCSATTTRLARQLARHVRPRRHAQRARAVANVRDDRPFLRRPAATPPTATSGSRRRTRRSTPCGRCTLAAAIRLKASIELAYSSAVPLGRRADEEQVGRGVRRIRAVDRTTSTPCAAAHARRSTRAPERRRVPSRYAQGALQHALRTSRRSIVRSSASIPGWTQEVPTS